MSNKPRQSNLELLRIISMLMVLTVHIDGASLGLPALGGNLAAASARDIWQLGVEALAIVGVNCFTLISGYFGIRLRWRSAAAYLFQCIFYSVLIYTAAWIFEPGHHLNLKGWLESWMVLTHTDLWYVPVYFALMLIAPVLNAGFAALTRRQATAVVGAFAAFNLWAGWGWGASFNPTGYTLVQLIMMYLIGRYVAEFVSLAKIHSWWAWGAYLAATTVTALYAGYNPAHAFAYNAPAVVLASVALLTIFAKLRFISPTINYIARSAFAVYLLHKAPLVWGNCMRPSVRWLWEHNTLLGFTLVSIALMIGIYALSMVLDAPRRAIFNRIYPTKKEKTAKKV